MHLLLVNREAEEHRSQETKATVIIQVRLVWYFSFYFSFYFLWYFSLLMFTPHLKSVVRKDGKSCFYLTISFEDDNIKILPKKIESRKQHLVCSFLNAVVPQLLIASLQMHGPQIKQ